MNLDSQESIEGRKMREAAKEKMNQKKLKVKGRARECHAWHRFDAQLTTTHTHTQH